MLFLTLQVPVNTYGSDSIKAIIDFKWKKFGQSSVLKKACLYMTFVLVYTIYAILLRWGLLQALLGGHHTPSTISSWWLGHFQAHYLNDSCPYPICLDLCYSNDPGPPAIFIVEASSTTVQLGKDIHGLASTGGGIALITFSGGKHVKFKAFHQVVLCMYRMQQVPRSQRPSFCVLKRQPLSFYLEHSTWPWKLFNFSS